MSESRRASTNIKQAADAPAHHFRNPYPEPSSISMRAPANSQLLPQMGHILTFARSASVRYELGAAAGGGEPELRSATAQYARAPAASPPQK